MTSRRVHKGKRSRLLAALERRAELLRPDPNTIVKAMRLCAKNDPVTSRYLAPAGDHLQLETAPLDAAAGAGTDGQDPTAIATAPTLVTDGSPPPRSPTSSAKLPSGSPGGGRQDLRRLTPGTVLAGYRIEDLIGKGGMGRVYRATQLSMNRQVALKVLAPRLTTKRSFRERFISEARHAGMLQHPNLIGVHDVGESEGLLFFSMELIQGQTLRKVVKREGKLDETRAFIIAHQTLSALEYAHEQGLIHRDIKPDNLMLTKNGSVKIADLGLARVTVQDQRTNASTRIGSVMGTPYYMAPEQGKNASDADHRSDLYSVGASLYHMVCGQVPFDGATPMETIMQAATRDLEWPSPPPSQGMRKLISTLMAKNPADRPQSAGEALQLLEKISGLSSTDISMSGSTSTLTSTRRAARRRRRSGAWVVLTVTLLTIGLLAGAWFAMQHWQRRAAWKEVRGDIVRLVGEERFREARERLRSFAKTEPAYPTSDELANTADGIDQQWNTWTREHADLRQRIDLIHEHLMHRRIDEAQKLLDGLRAQQDLLSPAVRKEIRDSIEPPLAELRSSDVLGWLRQARCQPEDPDLRLGREATELRGLRELRLSPDPTLPERFRLTWEFVLPEQGLCSFVLGDRGEQSFLRLDLLPRLLCLRRVPYRHQPFFRRYLLGRPGGPPPPNREQRAEQFLELGSMLHEQTHSGRAVLELNWDGAELGVILDGQRRLTTRHDPRELPLIVQWLADEPFRVTVGCDDDG